MNQVIYKNKITKNIVVGNSYNAYKLPAINYIQRLSSINIPFKGGSYKWTEKQITEFLGDIWNFRNSYLTIPPNYCLRSVIVEKTKVGLKLITGSEQLITTYIILYVLREDNFRLQFESKPSMEDAANIRIAIRTVKNWFIQKELETTIYDVRSVFGRIMEQCTQISYH